MKLYEPIHDRFEKFCRARVYGEMDYGDLMNESLLIAYQKFDEIQEPKAFLSYLFTVAIRVLSNANRKRRTERIDARDEMKTIDPHARTDRDAEVQILYQALAELPDAQRECLILFEITGFSIKDIMQMQGVGESTVKQRLRRGRMKLKEMLMDKVESNQSLSHG